MCDKPMGFRRKRGNRYGVGGEFVEYSVIVQIVRLTQRKADSRKAASEVGSATPPLSPHLPASPPSYLERGGGFMCVADSFKGACKEHSAVYPCGLVDKLETCTKSTRCRAQPCFQHSVHCHVLLQGLFAWTF